MKVLFFILFSFLTQQLAAHNPRVTDQSIVKDSAGMVYPAVVWQTLYMKGGYELKAENPKDKNTAFFLVPLSQKEKEARLEKLPKPKESDFFKTGKKLNL